MLSDPFHLATHSHAASRIPHPELRRMPAEWEPHHATWIGWPHHRPDWPGKFEPIPWVYAEIVRHLVAGEDVHILIQNAALERRARRVLEDANVSLRGIKFHRWPTDRVWTRDSAAIFVKRETRGRSRLALTGWRFTGWAKYSNYKRDAQLPARMAEYLRLPLIKPVTYTNGRERQIVLEGGSIDVNGRGALLTTEECLLSKVQPRNPGLNRSQLEKVFAHYLGAPNVIWLGQGIAGDDTHGHVDDIARFVNPTTVVAASERDPADVNYKPLRDNLRRLKKAKDQSGQRLRVIELPMPAPVVFQGRRLPASYANFYICNRAVLVPTFNDANDRLALNVLADLFPARKIVPIYSGDFIWGFGAMHCMTQQQPA
jgi:agmatine deiminase